MIKSKPTKTYEDLTPLQQGFVSAFNGSIKETAAIAKVKYDYARELYTKPHIKQAIAERHKKEFNHNIASRQDRQKFWSDIMHNILIDDEKIVPQLMPDRLKASELLGRSEADFTDGLKLMNTDETNKLNAIERREAQEIATIRLAEIVIQKGHNELETTISQFE